MKTTLWAAILSLNITSADFVYPSFNSTTGIAFVGAAKTSSCIDIAALSYGQHYEQMGESSCENLLGEILETTYSISQSSYKTVSNDEIGDISKIKASFGHRSNVTTGLNVECPVRARLVPSLPNKSGAIWYRIPVPVLRGFETMFTFQITDHSRVCTEHKDPLFSSTLHKSCSVQGGDGFAFVMHQDAKKLEAIGDYGAGLGYAGIETSLAVEFDIFYNPEDGSSDYIYDHIAIHAAGKYKKNSWKRSAELSIPKVIELGDGQHHLVKIRYFPYIEMKYAAYLSAAEQLLPFIVDNGENRRVGTLVVWIDDSIQNDTPIVAIPVNLSILLDIPAGGPGGGVYVGFTAGTGRGWAKHDILSWYWCHQNNCEHDKTSEWEQFDYHQTSKYFTSARYGNYGPTDWHDL